MKKHSYSIYRHIVVIVLIPFIILTLLLLGTYEVYRASMFGARRKNSPCRWNSTACAWKSG